jgi:hypothetical protein
VQVWCEASAELPVMLACILRALHSISLLSFIQLTLAVFLCINVLALYADFYLVHVVAVPMRVSYAWQCHWHTASV